MIKNLYISNYALISEIDIDFAPGFNIITGETGAGKSIILGALSLLLGGRADLKAIREAGRKSVIEAAFDIADSHDVTKILEENELVTDSTECVLRRELMPGGRSRAFVNDIPVTLPILRDVAVHLVDIHSQNQNLLLSDPSYQLDIIDHLAGTAGELESYQEAYAAYRQKLKNYTETRDRIRRNQADSDFISYQYEQLAGAELQSGEDESLEQEREILSNLGEIKEKLNAVLDPLTEEPHDALAAITNAVDATEHLAFMFGDNPPLDFHSFAERLESVKIEISDIVETLSDYSLSLKADPSRLEEVDERLNLLYSLETKHHVDNTDALIELRDRLGAELEALQDSEGVLSRLETEAKRAKKHALQLAGELSERRAAAASEFSAELRSLASTLGMPNLRCEISLTKGKLGPEGIDQIQFLFAFNKNQSLMPVGGNASGGEISRLMLTVKAIVAERMHLPTIIFDEVDTGVSGDIASRMARMMADMGRKIQVITITHLPGVAAMGVRHYKVYKEDDATSTSTRIHLLDRKEREAELALMLSGSPDDEAALANARSLLDKAEEARTALENK